jgi:hypothetical protein
MSTSLLAIAPKSSGKRFALGAIAAASLIASAHAEITFKPTDEVTLNLYGSIDFSLAYQDKSGGPGNAYAPTSTAWTGVNGGGEYTNKFGLKGEYVKPAYTVGFDVAGSVATNSGTSGNSQPSLGLFNDRFNVYLKTSLGTFTVGEQLDPAWLATIKGDNRGAPQSLAPIAGVWSVAQGTQSTPQTDMKPTNSLGYSNKFGKTAVGLLYKPYSNQSGGNNLQNGDSSGSQSSLGVTYDDGTYLATAGYLIHHGVGGTQSTDVDIQNQSVALGYTLGPVGIKGGYMVSNSPVGIATGTTIFSGWNTSRGPLNKPSQITVSHLGSTWRNSDQNKITLTYYDLKDTLNEANTAQWVVVGDNYRIDRNLMIYGNLGFVKAGPGANPLTAGTGPNNVAKPDDTSTQVNVGFTFFF